LLAVIVSLSAGYLKSNSGQVLGSAIANEADAELKYAT
jgi:hypothetical protein